MKNLKVILSILLLLCVGNSNKAIAESSSLVIYEAHTESKSSSGSSGTSRSRSRIMERLIGAKNDGLELEYSFVDGDVPANDAWKLPARVLNKPGISIELLNETEIETRLKKYLDMHPEIRERCGGVVFTWTAFEIHCDTNHVIDVIKGFNLYLGPLSEGKLYEEPGTLAPSPLKKVSSNSSHTTLIVDLELDPTALQSEYKKDMQQVASITGESIDSIMSSSMKLSRGEIPVFSGNKLVTIELRADGHVVQIKRETTMTIRGGGSFQETRKQTEILIRQPIKSRRSNK